MEPLIDGEEAFPAMLEAIESAERSLTLVSYIFDADRVGSMFAEAVGGAVDRGVSVRVLIDAAGARYSVPRMAARLRRSSPRFRERFFIFASSGLHASAERLLRERVEPSPSECT